MICRKSFISAFAAVSIMIIACKTIRPPQKGPIQYQLSERLQRLNLRELDGRPVDLALYSGKPIFLNFWATWCGPCKTELPEIAELAKRFSGEMIFLFASNEEPEKINAFIAEHKLNLHFIQLKMEYIDAYIIRLPTTFLIDKQGQLIAEQEGYTIWDQPTNLKRLKELIGK